jgi:hypothetical protein
VLPVAAHFAKKQSLSACLWARRLIKELSARLRESMAKKDSKLVHGRLPIEGGPHGFGSHIAQCQPEQLDGSIIIGEVPASPAV